MGFDGLFGFGGKLIQIDNELTDGRVQGFVPLNVYRYVRNPNRFP